VQARLEAVADGTKAADDRAGLTLADPQLKSPRLQRLCGAFGLTAFEAQVLLLCLAVEIRPDIAALCARCQGAPERNFASFRLAIALFPGSDWKALTPGGALRAFDLVRFDPAGSFLDAPVRLEEFALHALCGAPARDRALQRLLAPLDAAPADIVPSQRHIADQLAKLIAAAGDGPVRIQLCGGGDLDSLDIAAVAARAVGCGIDRMSAEAIPASAADRAALVRAIERDHALEPRILVVTCAEEETGDRLIFLASFLDSLRLPVVVLTPVRLMLREPRLAAIEVVPPTREEQQELWRAQIGEEIDRVADVVARFNLRPATIRAAAGAARVKLALAVAARGKGRAVRGPSLADFVGEACREEVRGHLEPLSQRITVRAGLDDLVLTPLQRRLLDTLAEDMRQQSNVLPHWGADDPGTRGLGMCALFTGPAGTGKTTAAEAIAHRLELDLYRVDLSTIVSKYIGETEKQLRRVFDAAESGANLLLFDESDALFGKRTEVRDSHDRYANQEVSYLLQKLETYRGLAVLTSNIADSLDTAFLRRFRYVVDFPLPTAAQREEIWRRIFPSTIALADLDYARLSRLNISGGHIRNIALQSTLSAAARGAPVTMQAIYQAAEDEYRKLKRALTPYELEG